MSRKKLVQWTCIRIVLPLLLTVTGAPALIGQKGRDQIPDRFKWNLADIFPSPEAWRTEMDHVQQRIGAAAAFKGGLGGSAGQLRQALETIFSLWRDLDKLNVYAYLNSIQDLRQSGPQAMQQEVERLYNTLSARVAYLEPEILAIPPAVLNSFLESEPGLHPYRIYLSDLVRNQPHMLSADQEWVVSKAGLTAGLAGNLHNILTAAELPWEKIAVEGGQDAVINIPGYEKYRASPDRAQRITTFNAFYSSLGKFHGTFAALLNGKIKENLFNKDVRNYENVLEMYLFPRKIPRSVYTGMIEATHRALPTLHRYLRLKKRLLGLEQMHYHDLYPEWLPGTGVRYEFDDARNLLEKAFQVLGPEYAALLRESFENRWIDVYPSPGKISGVSCEGSYDTHPFLKLNFNGSFADVSQTAHELGHAMHSCFTNRQQPYATAGLNSLIAETAATVNSSLLLFHVIESTRDPEQKMVLLGNVLETFRQTLFRQCLFAEFEYRLHQQAEAGKTLSADDLDRIYLELLRTCYGHDENVVKVDDLYRHEWTYISHYYIGFYHYFYCTSFAAANSIAARLIAKEGQLQEQYLKFLASGNTVEPMPLLQSVGVDLTSPRPMEETIRLMNHYLDIAEKTARELKK